MPKFIKKIAIVTAEQYLAATPDATRRDFLFMAWDGPIKMQETDWIVTYSDGRKEIYTDEEFKKAYEAI